MSTTAHNENSRMAAVLDSMVLLSTLLTALGVRYNVTERMAGRDPSEQEPEDIAFAHLLEERAELDELFMRLNMSSMYAASREEEHLSAAVRRLDDLLTLNQAAGLLHIVHQRLLSLYPSVSEPLIEEARNLTSLCRELMDAEDSRYEEEIGPFLLRALTFSADLERELIG